MLLLLHGALWSVRLPCGGTPCKFSVEMTCCLHAYPDCIPRRRLVVGVQVAVRTVALPSTSCDLLGLRAAAWVRCCPGARMMVNECTGQLNAPCDTPLCVISLRQELFYWGDSDTALGQSPLMRQRRREERLRL